MLESMLTLIDKIKMPARHGIAKIKPSKFDFDHFCKINIRYVIPKEKMGAKIYEYPIK